MNREIKFRAWDKEQKRMWWNVQNVYDSLGCQNKEILEEFCDCAGHYFPENSFGQVLDSKRYEVMQYIGLKDRNGKDIYEGDIIKFKNAYMEKPKLLGFVKYDAMRGSYCFTDTLQENVFGATVVDSCDDGICDSENVLIIGNIYENYGLFK